MLSSRQEISLHIYRSRQEIVTDRRALYSLSHRAAALSLCCDRITAVVCPAGAGGPWSGGGQTGKVACPASILCRISSLIENRPDPFALVDIHRLLAGVLLVDTDKCPVIDRPGPEIVAASLI
jgi:hypothetical protein